MKSETNSAIAKYVRLALILAILALVADLAMGISYGYCHGASHNAHGWYCQAVYQSDYTALE